MKRFTLLLSAMLLACATSLWAETATYQHVFNAKPSTGNNVTLSGVSWNITATALNNYNSQNYAGVQFGSKSGNGEIILTSPSDWNYNGNTKITEVRLWLNLGGTSVTPSVTIGGKPATSDGTIVTKNSNAGNDWKQATKVTFTPAADGNTGVVVINVKSVKAGYICAMEIDSELDNTPAPTLSTIALSGNPTKTTYMAGETFDPTGLVVTGTYSDGSTQAITEGITWEIDPDPLTAGTTSVDVMASVKNAAGKDVTSDVYTVTGLTVTAAKTLTSIAVSGTPAEFWKGDTFNHNGMTVTANWDDNSTTDVTAEAEFSTPDMTTAGVKPVTVSYKKKTATYNITVKTIANTKETAYTVAEAIALIDAGKDLTAEVFVKGIVSEIVTQWSDIYNNITYNISDDGTKTSAQFQLFRCVTNGASVGDAVIAKGKMKKHNSTYEFDADNEIVYNATPTISCEAKVAFGVVSSLANPAPQESLQVTAINLTEAITVTLSDGAAFTLSTTTLPAEGGTLIITPELTVGKNTATLTLTSGETSVEVALSATIKQAYTISWSVNGKVTSTSHVIDGENLVLPTTPEAPNECASKVFVGWATTATVAADGKDIVFVDAATPATADATYYAVFATATESETPAVAEVTFSNMFSDVTSSKDIDGVALVITDGITVTFAKSTSGSNKAQYYDNGKAVRLYGGGSITINSIVTITSFMLTFGDNDGYNALTADCGTWESPTWTGSANTIVLTEEGTTGHRRIAGISVTTKQTTWEEYTTTCTDTPSAIDNTAVETSVLKTIENGQLVIMRDGVKYNAMGVRLL